MSAEHLENFAQYGVGQQARLLNGVWAENGNATLVADPDPTASAGSVVCQLVGRPAIIRYVLGGARTKVGLAGRFWLPSIPDSDLRIPCPFSFRNGANNPIINVHITPTGSLVVKTTDDETGTILAQSSGPVVTANAWWHLECWVTFDVAGATIEVRREGTVVLSASLPTITAVNCPQVQFSTSRSSNFVSNIIMYVKDLMIMNGLGSANNDFVGSLTVFMLQTNSDDALNWTLTGGATGYGTLSQLPADDTDFISAGTPPPSPYLAGLSNLPADVTTVRAVMSQVRAQKVDGGDGNLQAGIVSGASTGLGNNRAITSAMTYWRDVFEVDPATGVPFLPSAVNAMKLQLDRTT